MSSAKGGEVLGSIGGDQRRMAIGMYNVGQRRRRMGMIIIDQELDPPLPGAHGR